MDVTDLRYAPQPELTVANLECGETFSLSDGGKQKTVWLRTDRSDSVPPPPTDGSIPSPARRVTVYACVQLYSPDGTGTDGFVVDIDGDRVVSRVKVALTIGGH